MRPKVFSTCKRLELEGGELTGSAEPLMDLGPVDFRRGVAAGDRADHTCRAERPPDALVVGVADLRVDDQVSDEMPGRGKAEVRTVWESDEGWRG